MIEVSFVKAVFAYLAFFIFFIVISWFFYENKEKYKKNIEDENYVWYCNICGFIYIDTLHTKVSLCPQCGSYIEDDKSK